MDIKNKSILVVDDNKANRVLLKTIFKNKYIIYEAENGLEALEFIKNKSAPDIILLDILMPVMDGYEFLGALKREHLISDIPVVAVTSVNDPKSEAYVFELGASDLITKPFDSQVIVRRVENVLNAKQAIGLSIDNAVMREKENGLLQLKSILDSMNAGVALLEATNDYHNIIYANKGFFTLFGIEPKDNPVEYINSHYNSFRVHPDDYQKSKENLCSIEKTEGYLECEYRIIDINNNIKWVGNRTSLVNLSGHDKPVILSIINDITKRKTSEAELTQVSTRLAALINNVPGGFCILDYDGVKLRTVYANEGLYNILGVTKKGYNSKIKDDILPFVCVEKDKLKKELDLYKKSAESFDYTFELDTGSYDTVWVLARGLFIYDASDKTDYLYLMCVDITNERHAQNDSARKTAEIRYRADHDKLTGIYNLSAFCSRTSAMLRSNKNTKYTLIRLNIERFKVINDLFGMETGDKLLFAIANSFNEFYLNSGTYGRIAGDNFVICIPSDSFTPKRFYKQLDKIINCGIVPYQVFFNIGIYEIEDISLPVDLMCDRAYLALQQVKDTYGTYYNYYDNNLRKKLIEQQEIVNDMEKALANEEFEFYLQPIMELHSQKIVYAEALARWNHPKRGMLSPAIFVPIFEKNGFIIKLDEYILDKVCNYIRTSIDSGINISPVCINLSRSSLLTSNLALKIAATVKSKYSLNPSNIKIEITESAYNDNPHRLIEAVNELKHEGFEIFMDDFGSGYSSLNTLKDIPVDVLKIDMKFMQDFGKSAKAGNILISIIKMAKLLDLNVVAEGVENKKQLDFLKRFNCEMVQGFYYSKPLPIGEFKKYSVSSNDA